MAAATKTCRSVTHLAVLVLLVAPGFASEDGFPERYGEFQIGFEWFNADPTGALRTAVWYPAAGDAQGSELIYSHFGHPYASPYLGGVVSAQPHQGESFPLVVLSHASGGGWPLQLSYVAESLASHGYVVAAPLHSAVDAAARGAELSLAARSVMERSLDDSDLLTNAVDPDFLAIGGFSNGAVTAGYAAEEMEPDAVLLMEAVGNVWSRNFNTPVAHIGGGVSSFKSGSSLDSPFFGIDVGGADHEAKLDHWSFFMQSCQFRSKLVEAGATDSEALAAVSAVVPAPWAGCADDLVPADDVQKRVSEYAVAYLGRFLKSDNTFDDLLATHDDTVSGDIVLRVRVDTDDRKEGLEVLLTDPLGRSLGFVTESGVVVNDFGSDSTGNVQRISNVVNLGLKHDALVSGEYVLTASGPDLQSHRDYSIELTSESINGQDVLMSRTEIAKGTVAPGGEITPVSFMLQVPEFGDCNRDGSLAASDLACVGSIPERDVLLDALAVAPGDLDGSGSVDFADFLVLSENFGRGSATYSEGNIDLLDGVTFADFLELSANFGGRRNASVAIPEPSGWSSICIGLLAMLRRSRRWKRA